ncbi:MAG: nicotinate (nicotinamide) nucleotide adenylyltransferase [Acidobacteria bacterium]|nr:nicotinate (nicotinamide) nucleotide adenylyltransferase [Acidobacteriota bacterium]
MTALFGGAFDPIHSGHLAVIAEVKRLGYDRVVLVPSGNPPHKPMQTPFAHRVAMSRLVADEVSEIESGGGRSYTFDTLQHFPEPRAFVIGADAFAEIKSWYRWREVLTMTEFIVVSRPGHVYAMPEGARVRRLDSLALDISSSAIRAQLSQGQRPAELPAAVLAYIEQHGLYRLPPPA